MVSNADCTIYVQQGATAIYARFPISGVFWEDKREVGFSQSGAADLNGIRVFISIDRVSLPELSASSQRRMYIVRGIVMEEVLDSAGLRHMIELRHPLTVTSVTKRDYGSQGMQHWEVTAR